MHLCVIYFSSGIAKARGGQWWNGEAIWRAVMQPQFHVFEMGWLASVPLLALLASWGTLLVEIGYPLFIWPARTRRLWLLAIVGMHVAIGLILGLWFFAAVLIVLNLAAFGVSGRARRDELALQKAGSHTAPAARRLFFPTVSEPPSPGPRR
jgi:hypothetical protein